MVVFVIGQCSSVASALSQDQKNVLQDGILYYNTDVCGSGTTTPQAPPEGNVYILGDSVTERSAAAYQQALQAKGLTAKIDAATSRGLSAPGTNGNKLSGLDAIDRDKDDIKQASAIVVALGTNGGSNKQNIDKAVNAIRANNAKAPIYWVDTFALDRPSYNSDVIKPANETIYGESKAQKYQVLSWFNTVYPHGNPQNPAGNEVDPNTYIDNSDGLGVHPTAQGSTALAKMVTGTVANDLASLAAAQNSPDACCSVSDNSVFGPGELPSYIKEPYNSIFTAAGKKYNVDPAVLVGFFYAENFGYTNAVSAFKQREFRDPPPPYGHGDQWPVSSADAAGPFQFIPSTYAAYAIDGNGDGKKEANDLTDESFSAAKYLANLGLDSNLTESKVVSAADGYSGGYEGYGEAVWDIIKLIKADEAGGNGGGAAGGVAGVSAPVVGGDCAEAGISAAAGSIDAAVEAAKKLSDVKAGYVWGGLHGPGQLDITDPARIRQIGADCSGSVSWVLHQAGMLDGSAMDSTGFLSWGEAGKGQTMTVWANSEHVFIELNVPGVGHYQLNTVAPGSTPSGTPGATGVGPRFYPWESPGGNTSGFTPRHWKGT